MSIHYVPVDDCFLVLGADQTKRKDGLTGAQAHFVALVLERATGDVWKDAPVARGRRRAGRSTAIGHAAVALARREKCTVAILIPSHVESTDATYTAVRLAAGQHAEPLDDGVGLCFPENGSQIRCYRALDEVPRVAPTHVLLDDLSQSSLVWLTSSGGTLAGAAALTDHSGGSFDISLAPWKKHWPEFAALSGNEPSCEKDEPRE